MRKGFTIETAHQVVKNTREAGIKCALFIMVGFPTEQEEDFHQTIKFLAKSRKYVRNYLPLGA